MHTISNYILFPLHSNTRQTVQSGMSSIRSFSHFLKIPIFIWEAFLCEEGVSVEWELDQFYIHHSYR